MALLSRSARVAFPRKYPMEERPFLWCAHSAFLLAGRNPEEISRHFVSSPGGGPRLVRPGYFARRLAANAPGPFKLPGQAPLIAWYFEETKPAECHAVEALWPIASNALRAAHARDFGIAPDYSAEKTPYRLAMWLASQPTSLNARFIVRVRDPRDVWASIRAFDRKRGFFGFGRRKRESENRFMIRFLDQWSSLFSWLDKFSSASQPELFVYRYEDFILETEAAVRGLEGWLGFALDAESPFQARYELARHSTSNSPRESIGKWRTSLSPHESRILEARLSKWLEKWGYADD